ncbi:MAG: TlpA family protein disulfide reductase [Fibromonadaceae bacterium]|jgi:thiol-disulfide isomerase/thioredoxin|nr:TlpA family protein disulfide reductase [Fibromonadaceae bacterium]
MIKVIGILAVVLTQAVFAVSLEKSERLELTPQLQKDMPWFVARDRSDKEPLSKKHLEALVKPQTKRVALVFFATWCIPCREGIVLLRDNQADLDKNNVQVILVNAGENDVTKIEEWIKAYGNVSWSVILDKFKNVQKNTGLLAGEATEIVFPRTILLDNKLKPLLLIGAEGKDWPAILWE